MSGQLLLVAASGLAREAAAACRRPREEWDAPELLGCLDDDPAKSGTTLAGMRVLGALSLVAEYPDATLLICAGKGTARRSIARRLAGLGVTVARYATLIDPSVHVPAGCAVGPGSILLAGTVLTADVRVGRHVVCMPHVTMTHDDVIDDFATLAAGVCLGGGVHIGEAAYLGMNSAVRERCTVGTEAVLGMGAVLVADQPAGSVWAGVPARDLTQGKESE